MGLSDLLKLRKIKPKKEPVKSCEYCLLFRYSKETYCGVTLSEFIAETNGQRLRCETFHHGSCLLRGEFEVFITHSRDKTEKTYHENLEEKAKDCPNFIGSSRCILL